MALPTVAYHQASYVGTYTDNPKFRWLTLERLDKFISTRYYTDVNMNRDRIVYRQRVQLTHISMYSVHGAEQRPSFGEVMKMAHFIPIQVGTLLGSETWSTHWLKLMFTVPNDWGNKPCYLLCDTKTEAQIWDEYGRPLQGLSEGDGSQRRIDMLLTSEIAKPGKPCLLYVEVACNRMFGGGDNDMIAHPSDKTPATLVKCEVALLDQVGWNLSRDLGILADVIRTLPEDSRLALKALVVANNVMNVVDPNKDKTWSAGQKLIDDFLQTKSDVNSIPMASEHLIIAVGHCHIDTAWLWNYDETKRKCVRSWSSAIAYMQQYPTYRFVCSQAQQMKWVKKNSPDLWNRILKFVENGQFIPVGGTWIEMDGNMPSGESICRQFLLGQAFFQQEFGMRASCFWLPDTFGYTAQLPQLIRGAGIRNFVTQKLSWNLFNAFPHHSFKWEGIDGSTVLVHFPPSDTYNSHAGVNDVIKSVEKYKERAVSNESLLVYGFGDGGGGPTPEMIDRLIRVEKSICLPNVKLYSINCFFERLEKREANLSTWVGELYFELHRGTYTSQAEIKRGNRRCEQALHDAEAIASVASIVSTTFQYPYDELTAIWEGVLLNQFHDVLPGSCINLVVQDAIEIYNRSHEQAMKLFAGAIESIVQVDCEYELAPVAINTLGWDRMEVVEIDECNLLSSQPLSNGKSLCLVRGSSLGCTFNPIQVWDGPCAHIEQTSCGHFILSNSFVKATFSGAGRMTSCLVSRDGKWREVIITESRGGNNLCLFDDMPLYWDAWDVELYHLQKRNDVGDATTITMNENGPLRVSISILFDAVPGTGKSSIQQMVSLSAHSPIIEFNCQVEWYEQHKLLKVEFPLAIRADRAAYEVPFGHVFRPTHTNTSRDIAMFEVCAHRWAALGEYGGGAALINDCKYGYSCHRSTLSLSLLRSPTRPDPQCDQGAHVFRYGFMPYCDSFQAARLIQNAYEFNYKMTIVNAALPGGHYEHVESYFSIDQPSVILETIKRAENKVNRSIVLRLYEAYGGSTIAHLRVSERLRVKTARYSNLLEDCEKECIPRASDGVCYELKFTPFQVRTIVLELN